MGFTPAEVGKMSLYQFSACLDGWRQANGGGDGPSAPTDVEFDAMKKAHGDA